jgi:hypothetical protein
VGDTGQREREQRKYDPTSCEYLHDFSSAKLITCTGMQLPTKVAINQILANLSVAEFLSSA